MTRFRTTIGAVALGACALSPLQASATLLLSPDGTTVYDVMNNVSWLADANLAATNRFGLPLCTGSGTQPCVNPSGLMTYRAAAAWVTAMNAANYLGHSNWQLPTTPSTDSSCPKTGPHGNSFGFNCTASALGSLYYKALGLEAPNTAVPIPNNTVGPFSNFQPYLYWSQTSGGQAGGYATFSFNSGFQGANTAPNFLYALPMIQGKISGTLPASGTGLEANPGGQTVYDPVTNVTWLANANLGATDTFGLPHCNDPTSPAICINQDGAMTWDSATQFVTNMNTYNGTGYLGQTNWELPPGDPNCPNYNCESNTNPMGELYYSQLRLSQGAPVVAAPNIAVGPFNHLQPYLYWACEGATIHDACQTDGPAPNFEWSFSFGNGFEGTNILADDLYVTAYFVGPPFAVASPTERPASTSSPTSSPSTTPTRTPTASGTVSPTPLPTRTPTPSRTANSTATRTPSASPTAPPATPRTSGTPTVTVTPPLCAGDCNHDSQVTVDEILALVNIALGNAPVTACDTGDANHDGQISVDEIVAAAGTGLRGCGSPAQALR